MHVPQNVKQMNALKMLHLTVLQFLVIQHKKKEEMDLILIFV